MRPSALGPGQAFRLPPPGDRHHLGNDPPTRLPTPSIGNSPDLFVGVAWGEPVQALHGHFVVLEHRSQDSPSWSEVTPS